MYEDDLCYIPTRGMCKINKVLDKEFFEDDPENIIKQEIITYKKDGNRIKFAIVNGHVESSSKTKLRPEHVNLLNPLFLPKLLLIPFILKVSIDKNPLWKATSRIPFAKPAC